MKKNIILYSITLFLFGCSQSNQSNDDFIGDWVIFNYIKYDKKETFENLLMEQVYPAIYSYQDSSDEVNTANKKAQKYNRFFRPIQMNEDSTWTFVFMADPLVKYATTTIGKALLQKYGEEGATKIFDICRSCFTQKGQDGFGANDLDFIGKKNNTKTQPGEKVMFGLNYIKYDKNYQFENVVMNEIFPTMFDYRDPSDELHKLNQMALEEMRFLKPNKINQDSTWTFLFMGDRFVDDANYYIGKPFIQKYGEEKAGEVLKEKGWNDSLARGQVLFLVEEVDISVFK